MGALENLEQRHTLASAVARYEELRRRDSRVEFVDVEEQPAPLTRNETLELLALGEIITRKASYGRQLVVARARGAGASWADVGQALGMSRQSAWEAHTRWIDAQAAQHQVDDDEGLHDEWVDEARRRAGFPDDD